MTIGDYPEYLALGFLLNQNMLRPDDIVTGVDYDADLAVAVVRTERATDYEQKLKKKVQTSGCAQGTVFGDLMEVIETARLPDAVVCYTDTTIAMPLLTHYALARHAPRKLRRLYDKRGPLIKALTREYFKYNKVKMLDGGDPVL
jgi:hypothetical protein